ncbi:MAG: amino acid ABC transporter permease [Rhodospirillales bacterium]|nr:amino acid ABC transporter permease [Rhodospirillales bacterium]
MSLIVENAPLFVAGLWATLRIAVVTLIASTLIGFAIGTMATARTAWLRWIARAYTEVLRAVPLIVNLFFVYFVAPLLGLALSPYLAVVVGLSLWGGANAAEVVRGGLLAVPRHQRETARALGLREWQVLLLVVIPQALRAIVPALAGLLVLLLQSTSLGALVGVSEFFRVGQLVIERTTVMQGLDPAFGIYAFMLAVYFVLCSALTLVSRRLERRLGGRHLAAPAL